jgi:NAD(P)-dependent dehydrogenase (short-subunit alcohol dehydrogenase family)
VVVELLDLKQTHAAATDQLISKFPSLDMLVLNAGIMAPPTLLLTDNGKHEQQWQVNHLAQFQLLKQLTPSLKKAPAPRVVFVSSLAHYFSPAGDTMLSLSTMRDPDAYSPNTWYGWSKLCNILTARHLAHLEPSIASHAVHPGGVQGKLLRYAGVAMGLSWYGARFSTGICIRGFH